MDQVIASLAIVAMAGAALFGVLALMDTGCWAARWLAPRKQRPHDG